MDNLIKVGLFSDRYDGCTGFANVCRALGNELSKSDSLKVYYFGRFGLDDLQVKPKDGFVPTPMLTGEGFMNVPCQGGVWERELCVRIIKHYGLDVVLAEDDWWSISGLCGASKFWSKPFHLLTPIDALPVNIGSNRIFELCHSVYVPNSSYKIIKERGFNSYFLPHGVYSNKFKPSSLRKQTDQFRFLFVGRNDERKALGRVILAYEKLLSKVNRKDVLLVIHTDWFTPNAQKTKRYIELKRLPIGFSQMSNTSHLKLVDLYNSCHVNLCTSRAGGFELPIIESASCCVPSLVNDWTFMNELVIDGLTGLKVPYSDLFTTVEGRTWANIDVDKLAEAMLWCVNNRLAVEEMGVQARLHVKKNYSWEKTGEMLTENLIKSV